MTEILPLSIGSVIQNTYRIDGVLGQGGMGATYRGTNLASDHQVAIKVVLPEYAQNEKLLDLFRREAKLLRTVQDPAVVRYETTIQDGAGPVFLVMEFIQGKPLSHYVSKGARLRPEDVLKLGQRLASGLAAIHALGIVHRDLSPENILIPDDEILHAKLIDFGLASDTVGTEKSIIGDSFAGKVSFAAPEQLMPGGAVVTPATDVYALALVLLQVAGAPVPGLGRPRSELEQLRQKDIVVASEEVGSEPLAQVLSAMLRRNPSDRATDIADLFARAIAGDMEKLPKPNSVAGPGGRRLGGALVAGLLVATIAAGIAGLTLIPGAPLHGVLGNTSGTSLDQVRDVPAILAQDDPLSAALNLARSGDFDERNTALAALVQIGRTPSFGTSVRTDAWLAAAEMYDPATYDAPTSAALEPSVPAARNFYRNAVALGSSDAERALEALPD